MKKSKILYIVCMALLTSCSLPKKVSSFDKEIMGKTFIKERHNSYILVSMKNGNRHGRIAYYDLNGDLVLKGRYSRGKPIGFWKSYYSGKSDGLTLYLPNDTICISKTIHNIAW